MRITKNIGCFVFFALLIASGWFIRGMVSGGGSPMMGGAPGMGGAAQATEVRTSTVAKASDTQMKDHVGHVKAIQDVAIYAQVSGTIQSVHFKEGSMVKQGDLLFTIDPKRYEAEVQVQKAALAQAQAKLESAKADLDYAQLYVKRLKNAEARSVVQADVDKAKSELLMAKASLQQAQAELAQAQADLDVAEIDLGYTEIKAPIDGKIGKAELTRGDYVSPGSGVLAQLVQISPIRIQFSLSDRDFFNLTKKNKPDEKNVQTQLRLPNDNVFSESGTPDFFENKMNLQTGTITTYMRFDNTEGILIPDMHVTVQIGVAQNDNSQPVVPQLSVMTNAQGEYVYVVSEDGIVEKRQVKLGELSGENRIVTSGLAAGEHVVTDGVQKVKPGQSVKIVTDSSSIKGAE